MTSNPHKHLRKPGLGVLMRGALSCIAAAFLLGASTQAAQNLPHLGDGELMSIAEEKELGIRIAREIYRDPDYIDDPIITAYVQGIWTRLLEAAQKRGDIAPEQQQLAWEIMTGKDRSINAFALPGGYFGLHFGLIAMVSSPDELASVLAHELSHVTQRHIARQISKQNAQAPWLIGAMIMGALAASKNPDAANAVLAGSQAVGTQSQLNFSRDMEREADRVGFGVLQDANMDVRGFAAMFDKLQHANRINDNGSFPYLRTHPLTTERLADMQTRLQGLASAPPASQSLGVQIEHTLVATRAKLLSGLSSDALRSEMEQARLALRSSPPDRATPSERISHLAQLYGGAIAAHRARDSATALRYTHAARQALMAKAFAGSAGIDKAQAMIDWMVIDIALGVPGANSSSDVGLQAAAAFARLRALPGQERERATLLAWAELARSALLPDAARQRSQVIDALQTWVANHSRDALAWQALSLAHEAQGQTLRSLRAAAEARLAILDYSAALDRLKAAQQWAREHPSDHIDASIIDSRTRAVQTLVNSMHTENQKR